MLQERETAPTPHVLKGHSWARSCLGLRGLGQLLVLLSSLPSQVARKQVRDSSSLWSDFRTFLSISAYIN